MLMKLDIGQTLSVVCNKKEDTYTAVDYPIILETTRESHSLDAYTLKQNEECIGIYTVEEVDFFGIINP